MALMALFCFVSLARNLHGILAAPTLYMNPALSVSSGFEPTTQSLSTADAGSLSPFLVIPWMNPHRENQYAFSVAIPTLPTTTVTVNIAQEPTTVTLSPAATTVTAYVTVPMSSQTPTLSPTPTISSVGALGPAKEIWVAPVKMDDLSSFGITSFNGRNNLEIVTEIPANAWADGSNASTISDNSTSILQLFYPQDSVDPARKPEGGAQFYATPLDISDAQNVSLQYSVFFPENFDFVLAGKMPGLYAGRTGCSGGDAALDCFSTRLMWRREGAGELYLVRWARLLFLPSVGILMNAR